MKKVTLASLASVLCVLAGCQQAPNAHARQVRGYMTSCVLGTCVTRFEPNDDTDFTNWCPRAEQSHTCSLPVRFHSVRGTTLDGTITAVQSRYTIDVQWNEVKSADEVPFIGTLRDKS